MSLQASGGGKGGGSGFDGYWYYGSFAGVICLGPVDELVALSIDKREVWRPSSPIKRSEVSNPFTFTVGVRGDVHFYWGTADQSLTDHVLGPIARGHPDYRHRAVIVFDDFVLGQERETVPEIEVLLRRAPNQSIITGPAGALDDDGQANPIAFLAELWSNNIYGLGRSADDLDVPSWQSVADAIDADKMRHYLSPVLRQAYTFHELLDELRGYLPLWIRLNSVGRLALGLLEVTDPSAGVPTTITQDDLSEAPRILAHTWDEADTRLDLRYLDRENGFNEERVRFESVNARLAMDTDRTADVDRLWITRNDQAQDHVAREGLRNARPWDEIHLSVLHQRASNLMPGESFHFSYAPLAYSADCRVIERKGDADKPGSVTIRAETWRDTYASLLAPLADPNATQEGRSNPPLSQWRVLQAPPELAGAPYRVMILAGRQSTDQRTFQTYMSYAGEEYVRIKLPWGEQMAGARPRWAIPVRLAADYADSEALDDNTGALQIMLYDDLPTDDFQSIDGDQTEDEIADDNLLLVVVDSSDDSSFEILTVKSIESPSGGVYPLHVLRARFGTSRLNHVTNDPAWLILRERLEFFQHSSLMTAANAQAPQNVVSFKVTPGTSRLFSFMLDLAQITPQELTIRPQLDATVIIDGNADL